MAYDNTNTGTLFKNDTEGKSENFPPYGGKLNVNYVSAWVKDGKNGKFFSLAIKPKEGAQQHAPKKEAPTNPDDFADDDIPF